MRVTGSPDVALTWLASCSPDATDYAAHEGMLGRWYSHAGLRCSTAGALSCQLTPRATNAYYLVVPMTGSKEGSCGHDSLGAEHPRSLEGDCRFAQRAGCP